MRSSQGPVAEMRRQAERMTAIIRDLLELSRLEETDEIVGGDSGRCGRARSPCCARTCSRGRCTRRTCACGSRARRALLGDEPEIHSAFSNLVDNAAKYTPPRARWRSAGGWTTTAATSPSPTPAWASRRSTSRGSPSASTAWMRAARAPPAARVSGWPSSSTCCSGTGRRSRCRAPSAAAAPSPAISRRSASSRSRVAASAATA